MSHLGEPTGTQAQVDRYLDAILTRLLDGALVPFLGAGTSNECKAPSGDGSPPARTCESGHRVGCEPERPDPSEFSPRTGSLKRSLANWLWARCKSSPDTAKRAARLLHVPNLHCSTEGDFVEKLSDDKKLSHGNASLDRLAEVCTWLSDPQSVCRVLRIERFTTLVPRPAHRYLAYLCREGVIDEIVTTNWDTCIEQALARSFGPRLAARLDQLDDGDGGPCRVIRQIDEYRRWGACRRRGRGRRRPVLRLYKINGCAAAYERDAVAEADRIALTDRQLQGFRDNHWAADLFRDRARSRTLLFSGFGSAEPQIRHAVLALASEFQAFPTEARRESHAPFVHVYEESPTFHQYQLLRSYYTDEISGLRVGLKQVVTALHADRFPDPRLMSTRPDSDGAGIGRMTGGGLDADRFWFGVYLVALRGLVERYSGPPFPFSAWLALRGTAPAREAMRLRRWLYPRSVGSGNVCSAPSEGAFGRFVALFRPVALPKRSGDWPYADIGAGPLRLWTWIEAIRGRNPCAPAGDCRGYDWYLPLRDASLLVLSSLYVLMALVPGLSNDDVDSGPSATQSNGRGAGERVHADREPRVWPDPGGVGLNVRVRTHTETAGVPAPFDMMLVEQGAPNPPRCVSEDDVDPRTTLCYQLAVTSRLAEGSVRVGRWERERAGLDAENRPRRLRTGRFVRLPALEVDLPASGQANRDGRRAVARTVRAIRCTAARLLPRTRARLTLRATYGGART